MKKRFTEEQIIKTLTRLKRGEAAKDLGRDVGVTPAKWMRELESENGRLKKLVADLSFDNAMLRDVNSKKW